MIMEKEDVGLSLSLNFVDATTNKKDHNDDHINHPLQFNLMPSSSSLNMRPSWLHPNTTRSTRGIDVNQLPSTTMTDCEEEEEGGAAACASSPNSTLSSVCGKRREREGHNKNSNNNNNNNNNNVVDDELLEMEMECSRGTNSDEEDGDLSRKKLRLSKDQSAVLEDTFKEHNTLNPKQKMALSKQLGLRPRQVEVWFQNRRARTKLKQTEVDCEFLKRCCDNLTEENRRLQKEVQELRALKLSPQFYMQMAPPTTLTMCPSCERVAIPGVVNGVQVSDRRPYHHHTHHLPVAINPWATAQIPHRSFDALHHHRS